jgi:isopenicillin N synthase-like dioxygenase
MVASSIPILDCSKISGSIENFQKNEGFAEFMEQLGRAMSGIGFVYLVSHGISSSVVYFK